MLSITDIPVRVATQRPGFDALIMLKILMQIDLREFERGSADILHYLVEAKRLAFESMAGTFADPDFAEMPIDELLSEDYAKRQFARIRPNTVIEPDYLAVPLEGEGDTTYLTVVDGAGMMVSLIQSNYRGMGSGLVPTGSASCCRTAASYFHWRTATPTSTHRVNGRSTPSFPRF